MTKVRLSSSVVEYRQAQADLVNEVYEENALGATHCERDPDLVIPRTDVTELWMPGLLRPPKIEMVWPQLYLRNGHLDGVLQIHTSEYFGVMNVYVTLEDEQGIHIESNYAMENDDLENHWAYIPSAPASPGTTIIVRAIVMDQLGSIGIQQDRITV